MEEKNEPFLMQTDAYHRHGSGDSEQLGQM